MSWLGILFILIILGCIFGERNKPEDEPREYRYYHPKHIVRVQVQTTNICDICKSHIQGKQITQNKETEYNPINTALLFDEYTYCETYGEDV